GVERKLPVPKGDVLHQFRKDVESGQLPSVSWLVPSQNFSDHPDSPWYGSWLTSEILDILTKNPEVWKKTIFILTYDENDGYFDHVPPFVAPDPKDPLTGKCSPGINTSGEYVRLENELNQGVGKKEARGGPIGLGFRVPMIIASPWSRGGKVCSQVFDHTSTLQFLEEFLNKKFNKNIKEENISDWRRTVCGNLTSVFTLYDENKKHVPYLSRDPFLEKIYNAKFKEEPSSFKKLTGDEIKKINLDPATSQAMSTQEPGTRPANPLPYQLYASGKLSSDKKHFEINIEARNEIFGNRAAGSPFIVYAPGEYLSLESERKNQKNFEQARAWHYALTAGNKLTEKWSMDAFGNNNYHLRVYGPNGFFREFTGNGKDPELEIGCDYERSRLSKNKLTGNLELNIKNLDSKDSRNIKVIDHGYGKPPSFKKISASGEEIIVLNLKESSGWYDFSIAVKDSNEFSRRYAGRVETGDESISDPLLGRSEI
ncbi:MAG: alkaline phosphatase family protein, partial [Ginsengibacter sp.]